MVFTPLLSKSLIYQSRPSIVCPLSTYLGLFLVTQSSVPCVLLKCVSLEFLHANLYVVPFSSSSHSSLYFLPNPLSSLTSPDYLLLNAQVYSPIRSVCWIPSVGNDVENVDHHSFLGGMWSSGATLKKQFSRFLKMKHKFTMWLSNYNHYIYLQRNENPCQEFIHNNPKLKYPSVYQLLNG